MKTIPIQPFLLPLLLFISLPFLEARTQSEARALLKWKSSLFQPDALSSWSLANSRSPCRWFGVRCNSTGSIVRLSLPNANLNGTLHGLDFASLPSLMKLNLNTNLLYGSHLRHQCHSLPPCLPSLACRHCHPPPMPPGPTYGIGGG